MSETTDPTAGEHGCPKHPASSMSGENCVFCRQTPAEPDAGDVEAHDHADGVYCDDCPDALRLHIKRIVVEHAWVDGYGDRDCRCGWKMPYTETHQHAGHVADELAAALTAAGYRR